MNFYKFNELLLLVTLINYLRNSYEDFQLIEVSNFRSLMIRATEFLADTLRQSLEIIAGM